MKVLLVVPTHNYRSGKPSMLSMSDFPSGYGYLAASLKEAGHTVIGCNLNNETSFPDPFYMITNKLSDAITEHKPNLIGMGGICTDYLFLKDAIDLCRRFAPSTPIVLGGGIISNDREFVFDLLHPDYALVGEAEETLVQLANAIQYDKPKAIHNLSYWNASGKPIHNPIDHNYRPLDNRPFPDYSVFGVDRMVNDFSWATRLLYRYSRTEPRPYILVSARSCPFSCSFCVHGKDRPKYRARSIENIMAEIKESYERHHFNILIILDELFAVNKERMREFCEAIIKGRTEYGWDFDWMFQTHASANLDLTTLQLAKAAGCFFFSYGIESASPTVLKSMNKKASPEQFIEAIRLAKKAKVGFGGNLIFGDVAESEMTLYESMDFYWQHCRGAFVFLAELKPYPGNPLFDSCVARGIIKDKADYYAKMDKGPINMTTMQDQQWLSWVNYIRMTENSWFGFAKVDATSVTAEPEAQNAVVQSNKHTIYRIEATCPYCGESIVYREMLKPDKVPLFLGTGCVNCNQRIKIALNGGNE